MTNFKQAQRNGKRGFNIADGPQRHLRHPAAQPTGYWGVAGFMPTRQPGQWAYTWPGVIGCPVFKVVEGENGDTATLDGGEISATFECGTPRLEIADWIDGQILELMRLQADIDCPLEWEPVIVNGQEIGPEIGF